MAMSWDSEASSQTLQNLKFEHSPVPSFLSAPGGDLYPPLFGASPAPSSTMNPLDVMTPQTLADDSRQSFSGDSASPEPSSADKKPVKKRKSWGQVLPEPKTNLPPRKRAKTEDEKEQRRVERVLRNRRAAQSSRERKRQEVEQLEKKNQELIAFVEQIQKQNLALRQENHELRVASGVAPKSSASFDALLPAPVTFSPELFSSQSGHSADLDQADSSPLHALLSTPSHFNDTVNPASLSPALSPVAEDEESDDEDEPATPTALPSSAPATSEKAFPDAMRHPAAMLSDLQCPSAEAPRQWPGASKPQLYPALALILSLQVLLESASTMLTFCQRPLVQIAFSMRAGFSIPPTAQVLMTIILLVTTPKAFFSQEQQTTPPSTPLTSTTTSTTSPPTSSCYNNTSPTTSQSPARPSPTLRLRTLRKILSCSPNCARPLSDATLRVLRLVQSKRQQVDRVSGADDSTARVGEENMSTQQQLDGDGSPSWFSGVKLPSEEVLITLLWAIRVEERKMHHKDVRAGGKEPGKLGVPSLYTTRQRPRHNIVLKVVEKARQAKPTAGNSWADQPSPSLA